jgi:hypothetical protein
MNIKYLSLINVAATIMATTFTISVYATEFVKDSYTVAFKTPGKSEAPIILPPNQANRGKVPFGEHSSGQSKKALAAQLNIVGEVRYIYDLFNAANIRMSAEQAHKLSLDKRVLSVEQDKVGTLFVQNPVHWGLDRIDEQTAAMLDGNYNDTPSTGAGRTIYILDSGLALSNTNVANEFTDSQGNLRASIVWDINGGNGEDCLGHGTQVASVAAGETYGVAKEATVIAVKATTGCTNQFDIPSVTNAFQWLAENAPAGTIVNFSGGLKANTCDIAAIDLFLENSIIAAHDAGIIVVVSAGNDSCDTKRYSPARISEAFVVGATNWDRIIEGYAQDEIASFSRTGSNISTFAPGEFIQTLDFNGSVTYKNGTSLAAPYVAGLFATVCQAAAPVCDTVTTAAPLYQALRDLGELNTVVNTGGTALPAGTTSRFIWKQW